LATAGELPQDQTENILKRMPALKVDPNGTQDFALRESSLPPPRTGNTIETPFPAKTFGGSKSDRVRIE
jgi:hypothetical protein